jgi:hypothetical protein
MSSALALQIAYLLFTYKPQQLAINTWRGWFLEPIHKVVESEESVVIPSLAPETLLRGAECGSPNTAVLLTATACATRVI